MTTLSDFHELLRITSTVVRSGRVHQDCHIVRPPRCIVTEDQSLVCPSDTLKSEASTENLRRQAMHPTKKQRTRD